MSPDVCACGGDDAAPLPGLRAPFSSTFASSARSAAQQLREPELLGMRIRKPVIECQRRGVWHRGSRQHSAPALEAVLGLIAEKRITVTVSLSAISRL